MFRFILGLVSGVAVGVAAATISAGQSGQDLRSEFERIRADIEKRDFEALGAHLEERFKDLQASLEERFAQVDEAAAEAAEAAEDATEAVEEAAEESDEATTA